MKRIRPIPVLLLVFGGLLLVAATASPASAAYVRHAVLGEPPRQVVSSLPASSAPSLAGPVQRIGGLRPRFGELSGGSSAPTSNWAGYDVAGGDFTSVSASWTQPSVPPTEGESRASFWVGFDGDGSSTVEQIGTEAYSENGDVSYYAWYEMLPAPEMPIDGIAISPGDVINASVIADGLGDFTLTINDATSGTHYTTTESNGVTAPRSAEVIAEEVTSASSNNLVPLADFGTVSFSSCVFDGQPISSYNWIQNYITADDGATIATTSALDPGGASFSVSTGTGPATDTTPPTTTVSGADALWHNKPVSLTFSATDDPGGSGVAYSEYSLDGGATWTEGTSLTVPAPADHSNDGIHTVSYRSVDNAGNVEATQTCQVKTDTLGPVCAAQNVSVKEGKACKLHFSAYDSLSPQVTTVLAITTSSGVIKKSWSWGYEKNFAGWWWIPYTARLPRGTYDILVGGKDLAGNVQSVIGRARLRVT